MTRCIRILALLLVLTTSAFCQKIVSIGVFTGLTAPFTIDTGIDDDARYQYRYLVKYAPIGFNFEVDYDGFGLIASPSYLQTGQHFNALNYVGGQIGIRKISMNYIDVPLGVKFHIIDLSFFKISFVTSAGIQYLVNGKETISHQAGKMIFPLQVYPILPPEYIPQYDGVLVPDVENYEMLSSKDFNKFQITGALGFRSDWEINEGLRMSFDLRATYSFLETRTDAYKTKLANYETLYDLNGDRREVFVYFTVGIARTFDLDDNKKTKGKRRGDKAYQYNSKRKPPKN